MGLQKDDRRLCVSRRIVVDQLPNLNEEGVKDPDTDTDDKNDQENYEEILERIFGTGPVDFLQLFEKALPEVLEVGPETGFGFFLSLLLLLRSFLFLAA